MATQSGNMENLNAVAVLWKKAGWRDGLVTAGEIACGGCRSATWCRYEIKSCAVEKDVTHCGSCGDYPCGKIREAFAKTDAYAEICKQTCSPAEYAILKKAFFNKKRNLNRR
jgi:hypothetical protein